MELSWITTTWTDIVMVLISSIGIYAAVIVFTRISGLRSFSKMSSFDFAMTVAVGSLIATTIVMANPPLIQAIVALAALYMLQIGVAKLRGISKFVDNLVDNQPVLLMRGTEVLEENMKSTKVTHDDIRAKLREANVTQMLQIKAVILETTGDISVLHNDDPEHELDDELLSNVKGWWTE